MALLEVWVHKAFRYFYTGVLKKAVQLVLMGWKESCQDIIVISGAAGHGGNSKAAHGIYKSHRASVGLLP